MGFILARAYNIKFNWDKGLLTGRIVSRFSNFFHSVLSSQPASKVPLLEVPDLSAVPNEYLNLERFSASSRKSKDQKLHPCTFFSRHLSLAEENYDLGNCELWAVVLALREWRHWLEDSVQPFVDWMTTRTLFTIVMASTSTRSKHDGCSSSILQLPAHLLTHGT